MVPLIVWILVLTLLVLQTSAQNFVPRFTDYSALNNRYLSESLPIGTTIGTIQANDPDHPGSVLKYYIDGNGGSYFACGETTGIVTLKKLLDFEFSYEIKMTVRVVDTDGQTNTVDTKVFINDENDNLPVFSDNAIFKSLSENATIGTSVAYIEVNDLDVANSVITVTCLGNTPLFRDACDKFELRRTENSNKYWKGNLLVKNQLDYETRISYAIQLLAFDGLHNVTTEVHVELTDINDTPPRWITKDPKTIDEELSIGTSVNKVSAVDGDVTNPRNIYYELRGSDEFAINSSTGEITIKSRIDFDNINFKKTEPLDLTIVAREVLSNNPLQVGGDPVTTSLVHIKITVNDIDDNTPTFDQSNYVAYVDENIVAGANVPGLQMTITDIDSGSFNAFNLVTLNSTNEFGIIPNQDEASSSATLFVKANGLIDYEKGPRLYIIQVEAREYKATSKFLTGTCTVSIYVRDVNDQTPAFSQASYVVEILETAPANFDVIDMDATDSEEGNFGTSGIVYKLYGNIPPVFAIDEKTGRVTVAACNTPGTFPCIDYERKKEYSLTVSATDNNGNGRASSVPLTIRIKDVNDNAPQIDKTYLRYINEGDTVPINGLTITAIDPDTVGGPLQFISNDPTGFWKPTQGLNTNNQTYANITAVRPVMYGDAPSNGTFQFTVSVTDGSQISYCTVTIIVIDINNNAPVFDRTAYRAQIREDTRGNVFIIQVTASDGDSPTTGNGQIDFSIQNGALGKFTVYNATYRDSDKVFIADIYTTPDATFDYDTQKLFEMQLLARDAGTPTSKMGNTKLTVEILDINNRDPRINPLSQSVSVPENEVLGVSVYRILAEDPDANSILRFSFTPDKAIDGVGNEASSTVFDYRHMFRIDSSTGNIYVNASLDRDSVARITYTVMVEDIAATPIQKGNGSFIIYIMEVNDRAPKFDQDVYNMTIDEEVNINSFVLSLNCRDPRDKIASYQITQTLPRDRISYLTLLPGSGALIVNDRIDFEKIERIELTGMCTDSGQPPLSNYTKIIINIRNINDNYPVFQLPIYRTSIPEGTYTGGPLNVTVVATDADKGDYGVVRYYINDTSLLQYFTINSTTGELFISPGATFDRETKPFYSFEVTAYDSPLNASVRKQSSISVYVTITDVNDNCPRFSSSTYQGRVPESAGVGTNIFDLIVTDRDEGINAEVVFGIKAGSAVPAETTSLFEFGLNGRLVVINNLRKKAGLYTFNATATDRGLNPCTVQVPVTVQVQESQNDAPEWIRPPQRDFVIYVLESQYDGMLVYGAKAVDNNAGPNGIVDYFFSVNGNNRVSNTSEFRINRVTGVIRAEIVYDREQRDTYFLTLVAVDQGVPAASSETTITIIILDVNDNKPAFPIKDGVVTPLVLGTSVSDGSAVLGQGQGLLLGQCNATDADSDTANNKIYYRLLASLNDAANYIRVDNMTCQIYLVKSLDFESNPQLNFDIYAYNANNDDRVQRYRREVNPSILPVVVQVTDVNDNSPVFTQTQYYQCVSKDTPFRQVILIVSATDQDKGDSATIKYSLSGTDAFDVDDFGAVSNIISFSEDSRTQFNFTVFASDGKYKSQANVFIAVMSPSNLVNMRINRPIEDVQPFKQQLIRTVQDSAPQDILFACISSMRTHVEPDGTQNPQMTDVILAAVNPRSGSLYTAAQLSSLIEQKKSSSGSVYDSIYVTNVEAKGDDGEFILKEDAVLAILIITILLIFLAIVLFIIACLCIRSSKKKKTAKIRAQQHTEVLMVPQPVQSAVNPAYQPDDDLGEYAVVAKKPIVSKPHSPVVVPHSPVVVQHVDDLPPPEPARTWLEPEPVIETEILPAASQHQHQEPQHQEHQHQEPRHFEPEFEDKIVSHVEEDMHHGHPYVLDEGEIETVIKDDSPTSSPASSPAGSRKSGHSSN